MAADSDAGDRGSITVSGDVTGASLIVGDNNRVTVVYGASITRPPPGAVNPYRGLESFDETSARFFFGREELVDRLCERLIGLFAQSRRAPILRFCAIIGPSGSGKSSIARAGLVPAIARSPSPYLRGARVLVVRPGLDPLFNLADALEQWPPGDGRAAPERGSILRALEAACGQSPAAVADALQAAVPPGGPLILLIDQFEEVYSLAKATDSSGDRQRRAAFVSGLLQAASVPAGPISLVITFRSDFFGAAAEHPDLSHAIAEQHELVPALTRDGLRRAILNPLNEVERDAGALAGGAALIDDATVERILDQTEEDATALPLFQFALSLIWEGLRAGVEPSVTLSRIGGIGGALAHRAEEVYEGLDERGRAIAKSVFIDTVQLADLPAYDTRKRLFLGEVATEDNPVETIRATIEPFIKARLLATGATAEGGVWVELPHEALIRSWSRLRAWTEEHREDLRFSQRLQAIVREWDRAGRPRGSLWREPDLSLFSRHATRLGRGFPSLQAEFLTASRAQARRERRTRIAALAAILILTIMAGIGMVVAIGQARNADRQRASADIALAESLVANGRPLQALGVLRPYLADESAGHDLDPVLGQVLMRALFDNRLLASAALPNVRRLIWAAPDRLLVRTANEERLYSDDLSLLAARPAPNLGPEASVADEAGNNPNDEGVYELPAPDHSTRIVAQDWSDIVLRDAAGARILNIDDRRYMGPPDRDNYRFSPDSQLLLLGHDTRRDSSVRPELVNAGTGARRFVLEADGISLSAFSPASDRMATYDGDRVTIWATGRNSFSGYSHLPATVTDLTGGMRLLRVGQDLFLVRRGEVLYRTRTAASDALPQGAASRNGALVLLGANPRHAELVSVAGRRALGTVETDGDIESVSFSPTGRYAIVTAPSGLWVAAAGTGGGWRKLPAPGPSRYVHFDPGEEVILVSAGGTMAAWELASGRSLGTLPNAPGYTEEAVTVVPGPGGPRFVLLDGGCLFAFSRTAPPHGSCGWENGKPVAANGRLLVLAASEQTARLADPLTSAQVVAFELVPGRASGVRILSDRLAAILSAPATADPRRPAGFGLTLVDYRSGTVLGRHTSCVGTIVAACGRTVIYLDRQNGGTVRTVPAAIAQVFAREGEALVWLVDEAGAVRTLAADGTTQGYGAIAPDAAARLAQAYEPGLAVTPGVAAMLCADGPCVIADLTRDASTAIADAGCRLPVASPRSDMFVCSESAEEGESSAIFSATEGRWQKIEMLPRAIATSYPAPWGTTVAGGAGCQQWLLTYANGNADMSYSGAELWDSAHGRSLMHFDYPLNAAPRDGGGLLASTSPTSLRLNGSAMPLQGDAIPVLCGREDALRTVDAILARASQQVPARAAGWLARLRRWAFG